MDELLDLGKMAKATGKRVNDWSRLKDTKEYLDTMSSVAGIPVTDLVQEFQGGVPEQQGTWAYKKVAIRFAQWCSIEFAVQVDVWIDELLTRGTVSLLKQENPNQPTLPKRDAVEITKTLVDLEASTLPAQIKQLLLDKVTDEFLTNNQPLLGQSEVRWLGCTQKAEEMGYKVNMSNRTKLGKFVKTQGVQGKKESRLCNGTMRSIYVYEDSEELEAAIASFYS